MSIINNQHNTCEFCIWWKSEEENGKCRLMSDKLRFCDINKKYTLNNYSCDAFKIEKFEADEFSTSTQEYNVNLDLEIERDVTHE